MIYTIVKLSLFLRNNSDSKGRLWLFILKVELENWPPASNSDAMKIYIEDFKAQRFQNVRSVPRTLLMYYNHSFQALTRMNFRTSREE